MLITNGRIFLEDGAFHSGTLRIRGEYIEGFSGESGESGRKKETVLDAGGCLVVPGFVDIHIHGCGNRDFSDGDMLAVAEIAEREAAWGVTSLCAATMTLPEQRLLKAAQAVRAYCEDLKRREPDRYRRGARILGINMEGPFIAREKKGSQREEDIRLPDLELVERLQQASGGRIRLLDFAPELPGADRLIHALKDRMVLSVAHTNADYDTALRAMKQGVRHVTHLCNAMSPYHHRAPGVVGAAFDSPDVQVELIADGFHNHPSVVRGMFRMFGEERILLISDSMRATGISDGVFELGGQTVRVHGKQALLEDGTIAASVTPLFDCVKNCVQNMNIPLESAVRCASINPAKAVGADDKVGSLAPGKYADVLLIRQQTFELEKVILRGKIL